MRERGTRRRDLEAAFGGAGEDLSVRDMAKGDDDTDPGEQVELASQIAGAVRHLRRQRYVVRRRTADGGRDEGAVEPQAVVAVLRDRLGGEAGAVQRSDEPLPRTIAGEHPAPAVRPAGP